MKHAILLLWHKDIEQLKELISLFDSRFIFYIHIDMKSKISKNEINSLLLLNSVHEIYSKYTVNWGGIKILKAQLFLLREIIKDKTIDYIHFMSGQDFIAEAPADIDSFFIKNNGREFIEYWKLPIKKWENESYERYNYFRFLDWIDYRSSFGKKAIDWLVKFQQIIGYRRNIPHHYCKLYGGSNWMSITRQCGEFLVSSYRENRSFYNRLKHTWAPEETYFPTIILNSPFAEKVINNNLRYIVWDVKYDSYPAILDEMDFGKIVLSESLFIRKIDPKFSSGLISLIKRYRLTDTPLKISSHGYWINESLEGYSFDLSLGKAITSLFRYAGVKTIADFGCGPGWYVSLLQKYGFEVDGYDGNPHTPRLSSLFFYNGFYCQQVDLTEEISTDEPFDAIICLAVCEYIPQEYENTFLDNLANNAKQYILLSWAVENQSGLEYLNCHTNEYVIRRMRELGFHHNTPGSNYLRSCSTIDSFKDSLMFFERTKHDLNQ